MALQVGVRRLPRSEAAAQPPKAAEGIGLMGSAGGPAVGDLTKALGDADVRMAAIGALAQMGPAAKESEKALRAMVEDKKNKRDKALMGAVKDALKKVKG